MDMGASSLGTWLISVLFVRSNFIRLSNEGLFWMVYSNIFEFFGTIRTLVLFLLKYFFGEKR